ncbi:MAG TPA: TauD/TfdA family dioxygenase [Stellaceae bacterium]|nr:TauD/TfdA family dioxygenase [Stellaceae bacterium]
MKVTRIGKHLGARIDGVDLSSPPGAAALAAIEAAFHEHGVIAISDQHLAEPELIEFSRHFGELELNVASSFHHAKFPHVNVLSNKRTPEGKLLGSPDAGQGWHTDMSYNPTPARASILYALEVPMRGGKPLGDTLFASMTAAWEALDPALQRRLLGLSAVHHFSKFYDYMIREKGSPRPPLTEQQKASKPPVIHPLAVRHPFTGRLCLYCDPGYTVEILGLPAAESRALLEELFEFQTRPEFQYRHVWRVGDVLMWDNVATIHMATGGYGPDEHRLMWRTQVLGDAARFRAANAAAGAA